jgi:hypothetical protein
MKKLLLTLDYELFGNGSGNVFKHIIEPTNKILDVVERHGAKLTVFFEVVEFWKLKQEWERGNHMGYDHNPTEAIEQQVHDMISRGHDVQLHIHPQWVGAKWEGGAWKVDYNNWRLGSFSSEILTIEQLIAKGKRTLEDIIKPSFPNYECVALRAGGYNAQPSQAIVDAMQESGLKYDSSVVPGAIETGTLSVYDYSASPLNNGEWDVDNCLECPSINSSDIKELPIVTFPIIRLFKFISLTRIKSILINRKSAQASFAAKTTSAGNRGGLLNKLSFFFQKEYQTWDYCLFPTWLHKCYLRNIWKQTNRDKFVVIGHPKSLVSTRSLEFLLNKTQSQFEYLTFSALKNEH